MVVAGRQVRVFPRVYKADSFDKQTQELDGNLPNRPSPLAVCCSSIYEIINLQHHHE